MCFKVTEQHWTHDESAWAGELEKACNSSLMWWENDHGWKPSSKKVCTYEKESIYSLKSKVKISCLCQRLEFGLLNCQTPIKDLESGLFLCWFEGSKSRLGRNPRPLDCMMYVPKLSEICSNISDIGNRQKVITGRFKCLKTRTIDVNACHAEDYLDTTDSFMGLCHADRLGWIFIRQNLSAAKVVGSKDDPVNKILWLTGTGNCSAKQSA